MNRAFRRFAQKRLRRPLPEMGLTKYLTQWIDDPTTPGERIQFRKPNWTVIEEARGERRHHLYQEMRETREVVGAELLAEWKAEVADAEAKKAGDAETTAVAKVPTTEEKLAEYDQLILLRAGIGDWTYCEPLRDTEGNPLFDADGTVRSDRTKPIPVTVEAIKDLAEDTMKWAGLTLVALIESGFRPIMPVVERRDDGIIDIRPGVDESPLAYSYNSTAPSMAMRA